MTAKRLIFIICLSLSVQFTFARQVPIEDAKQAGLKFYTERATRIGSSEHAPFQVSGTNVISNNGSPVYYAFTINDKGFVIVAAEDAVVPILAYSFEGSYPEENPSPQFVAWMAQYARQIDYARKTQAEPYPAATSSWKRLLDPDDSSPLFPGTTRDVEPMITSNWNQPAPYNEMCPTGSVGQAMVGCVPVAMGQIMYYYRWPDHGTGSYTYYDSTYGTQHVSFDSTWYRWNNMKNTINTTDTGIAQLLYHLGVSVDLKYGPSSSGMYNHKAAYSLRTYFKYSPETKYVFRDSTTLNWDSLILAHLGRKMPLYYAGWSVPNINGHAFVCDGNQGSDYFHFNFGWNGSSNGYYYLDNLTPGGNNFNLAQELIINIYPDTLNYSYPPNCSGSQTIAFNQGSLTDGSGPTRNYLQGADCSWLIDPQTAQDSISKITLTFDRFETGSGDPVTIYDGPTANSPVLGNYLGNTLPPAVSSTGNKMLITFKSSEGNSASGWSANYSTTAPVWCNGLINITADTAEITDGSLNFNYHNHSLCRWMITPANGKKPLTIYFKSLDTEPVKDGLRILDPDSHDTLAIISGHYGSQVIPDSVSSPSGKMYVIFSSNGSVTADGFNFHYPKYADGIIENSGFKELMVYPNPVHDMIHADLWCMNADHVVMTLCDIHGRPLSEKTNTCISGRNQLRMPVNNVPPGIYLLRLQNEVTSGTYKIVITNP
jgi:hypothetical protein